MKKRKSKNAISLMQERIALLFFLLLVFGSGIIIYNKVALLSIFLGTQKKTVVVKSAQKIAKKLQVVAFPKTIRVPILLYHYVEYVHDDRDTIRKSLAITPDVFEKQVQTLQDGGYTFLWASQLGDILDGKMVLPKKPIILTFDDGYRDFYTDVFPILKRHDVRATAYIVPGFLDKLNYLFTGQLAEIVENGLVEIGAHTMHHAWLKGASLERDEAEIIESKKILEQTFHVPVVSFAYPYGAADAQAQAVVKQAGFTTAVITRPGIAVDQKNRFVVFRIRPGRRTGETLLSYLNQQFYAEY